MVKGYYSYDPLSHVTSWSESILVMEETGLPEENPIVRLTMTETQLTHIDCRGEGWPLHQLGQLSVLIEKDAHYAQINGK